MKRATWRKRAEIALWFVPGINLLAGDAHGRRWRGHTWKTSRTDEADYRRAKRTYPLTEVDESHKGDRVTQLDRVWERVSWTCIGFFGWPRHDLCKTEFCECECHREKV